MKRKILLPDRRLLAIGVVYLAAILFGRLPDHLILFPSTSPIDARGAIRKTVPFENGQLELWTAKSRLGQQTGHIDTYLLRFYGNADRAERWVSADAGSWDNRAVEVWAMNYPGFGGSSGPARLDQVGRAALTAFDCLRREAASRPIIVFGTSLGTTAALDVGAHRPVAGLILQNPPAIRQMILQRYGWWNLWLLAGPVALQVPMDLDSVGNASQIHRPAIFLTAEKDDVIPPRYQRMVMDAYAGEKRVISLHNAGHNTPVAGRVLSEFQDALGWLSNKWH
jgi:uncharacterized protein